MAQHKILNVNDAHEHTLTAGDRVADIVAANIGSWRFIIIQSVILTVWIVYNILPGVPHFDPYTFTLCNLALSFEAAFSAPFIMMSQNRQAAKDRIEAENDYHTNIKAEEEVRQIKDINEKQTEELALLKQLLEEIRGSG